MTSQSQGQCQGKTWPPVEALTESREVWSAHRCVCLPLKSLWMLSADSYDLGWVISGTDRRTEIMQKKQLHQMWNQSYFMIKEIICKG